MATTGRLTGRTALITGAGSGIGEAIARRFAAEGANVVVTGVHPENTMAVADSIRASGGVAIGKPLDVSDSGATASAVAFTVENFGQLDVRVANAGLAGSSAYLGPLIEVTDAQWQRIIDVNLTGVFCLAREAAKVMAPQGHGCIITVGSVNSFVPEADVPAYAAAKGGVLLLTRSLGRDLGPLGIRVNGIAPGATETPRLSSTIASHGKSWAELSQGIPLRRQAAAAEIAAVAAFLASDDASYIQGEMIVVDGGMLCT